MGRRTLSALAAVTTAALLLAGCGGGDDKEKDEKIAGADSSSKTPSARPSKTDTADHGGPEMTFPKDFEFVLDWEEPTDPDQAAALDGAVNFVRAIQHGVVKQSTADPAYMYYSTPSSDAQTYAREQIQQHIDGGWTLTGVDRYTKPQVRLADGGKRAAVSFCEDQSKMFGKEVKGGKVLRTEPSDKDYYFYEIAVEKVAETKTWHATELEVQGEATQCKA